MIVEKMSELKNGINSGEWLPNRREFLAGAAALGLSGWAERVFAAETNSPGWSGLPARPEDQPLDYHALADAFDAYLMNPAHGLNLRSKDGRQVFPSALEGEEDGGLTTYGPVAMGRELRGEGLTGLSTSLKGYFNEQYGLFLDGAGATLCEYWYLMNVTALAYGLIGLRFGKDAEWLKIVERSAVRLKEMARQIKYDFNDQGYDFAKGAAFTNHDIYRQPDAVGGYSYVMLLAWKLTGKDFCLAEANGDRSVHGFCQEPMVRDSQRRDGGDGSGAAGGHGVSDQREKGSGICPRCEGWPDGFRTLGRTRGKRSDGWVLH